jgi:hypothetical protein
VLELEVQRLQGSLGAFEVLEPEVAHLRRTNDELQVPRVVRHPSMQMRLEISMRC